MRITVRICGATLTTPQWDQRLFTLDPATMSHVLQNTTIYEKPYPSRRLISGLIGLGMLSAEGQTHKRQRRVATPAFSIQAMRALVPLVFSKGTELKEKWNSIIREAGVKPGEGYLINVCSWASRATFDVMGTAGAYRRNGSDCLETDARKALTMSLMRFKTKTMSFCGPMSTCSRSPCPSLLADGALPSAFTSLGWTHFS